MAVQRGDKLPPGEAGHPTPNKGVKKAHEAHFTFVLSIRLVFVRGEAKDSWPFLIKWKKGAK